MNQPIANTYFAGADFFGLGLTEGGCRIQQSFEINRSCCAVQRANYKHEVIEGDIRQKIVGGDKDCDVMIGSYPCNRYSLAAEIHNVCTGDDLYLHYFRHVAIKRPEVFGMENVPGMRKFPVVMEAMTKLPNYYVKIFCPVSTQLWLPQKRDRLIIIGSKRRFDWREPKSTRRVTLAEILEDRPKMEIPDYVYKRLRGEYRDMPIISDPARGDIAPTCVAHYGKDQSTRLVVDKRYRRGVRPYTVREYARLQGVPDWFQFPCTDNEAYRMIGNGVSVVVGRWFGRELVRYFKA